MSDGAISATPLPEAAFALEVNGHGMPAVARGNGVEALHAPWEWALEILWPIATAPPPEAVLGTDAVFTLGRDELTRFFDGVITQVDDRGVTAEHRRYEVLLSPRLALLGQRTQYRIFCDLSSVEIVRMMLDEVGLYAGSGLTPLLRDPPPKRTVAVQFGETDLAFITRLLAEDGLAYTLLHDRAAETLLVFDGERAASTPLTVSMDGAPTQVVGRGASTAAVETLSRLEASRAVTPTGWSGLEFDFTHPQAAVKSAVGSGSRNIARYPGGFVLEPIPRGGSTHGAANGAKVAKARGEMERAAELGVRGVGVVTGVGVGQRVALADPGDAANRQLDGEYLVTRVVHRCVAPEHIYASREETSREERYENQFDAVPVAAVYRPAVPPKPRVMFPQSATVIGETDDSEEEIVTDVHGRVLVRFHWDVQPASGGGYRATPGRHRCWLRVAQSWAGPGWGFHFTPRVGMEVIVHFLDGDPDRPFVAGCLPNAANVPPVEVPSQRTQSAIRTRSSPKSEGFNELRFEDLKDAEEVYLHAQRDQRIEVLHDRSLAVGNDARAQIDRDESLSVGRDRSVDVLGHEQHSVEKNRDVTVGGDLSHEVTGATSLLVHKSSTVSVDEKVKVTINDGLSVFVGSSEGSAVEVTPKEVKVQTPKRHVTAVGDDVTQELTTEKYTVKAPKGLALVCGDTRIEIGEDKIVLQTKGGAKVELSGDKISIKTDGTVTVKGSNVANN